MTLIQGQTNILRNPEFDGRIRAVYGVDENGNFTKADNSFYRGRIETADRDSNGYLYRLQFLYNPTSLQHAAQTDTALAPAIQQDNPLSVGNASAFLQISQTVSFNLMFDRTYETWDGKAGTDTHDNGVLADIKYLYAMLGMFDGVTGDSSQFNIQHNSVVPEQVLQITPTAPMQFRPVWVIFGPKLSYYGTINSMAVTFTHFTQQMTPNRCSVDLSMQLIPKVTAATQTARDAVQQASNNKARTALRYLNVQNGNNKRAAMRGNW